MNNTSQAIIEWLAPEAGGRRTPAGPHYRCVVRFDADPDWSLGMWTLVLVRSGEMDKAQTSLATIAFAADAAPTHLLEEGARFDLMEGPAVVASGTVVAPAVRESHQAGSRDISALA